MSLNILVYLSHAEGKGNELLKAVAPSVAGGRLEVFLDRESFTGRIREPKDPSSVVIIWNPTQEDLLQIGALRHLLSGVRILLVLADDKAETIGLAHKVLPVYISYVDDGISEIVTVLERLTKIGENNPPSEGQLCGKTGSWITR